MQMFSTPASIYASRRFERAAKAEQALDQARAIRRPEWALRTRNLAAPSVGAHENARIDAHAPGADNAGGNIMLMRMEMIWRIHISAYAAHMHAMAATRWLASHTRRLGGSHHLGLVDGRAHRTCTGCTGMDGRGSVARTGRGREWAWGAAGASTAPEAGGGGAPLRAGRRPTRPSKRRAAVGVAIQIAPDLHDGPGLMGGDVVPREEIP